MTNQERLTINDDVVHKPLKSIYTYVENSVEQAFPISLSSIELLQYFVVATVKISQNTWAAARYLCADNSSDTKVV